MPAKCVIKQENKFELKVDMEVLVNDFSPGLFIMQTVILVILILLLKKFAWKPVLDSIQEREDNIKGSLKEAEDARKQGVILREKNEKLMNEVRAERDNMLKTAKEQEAKVIAEAKIVAKEEADKMLASARETISKEKAAAMIEMKAEVAKMSIDIAEKILKSELSDEKKQTELANRLVEDINLN